MIADLLAQLVYTACARLVRHVLYGVAWQSMDWRGQQLARENVRMAMDVAEALENRWT